MSFGDVKQKERSAPPSQLPQHCPPTPVVRSALASALSLPPLHAPVVPLPKSQTALREEARSWLDKNTYSAVCWWQFALMNNTSLVRNTSFDSGLPLQDNLDAYSHYLAQVHHPFSLGDNGASVWKHLQDILGFLKDIVKDFPSPSYTQATNKAHKASVAKIQAHLIEQLKANGCAYLPLVYAAPDGESSHAVSCKITVTPTHVTVTFFNLGEGSERHPDLSVDTTQFKASYSYYPVQLTRQKWEELGPVFIGHLTRYLSDVPAKDVPSYKTDDLYDLLHLLGPLTPSLLEPHVDKLAAKPQYVGDCSGKAVRCVLIDYLRMQLKADQATVNKVFLNLHFHALVAGFCSYKAKADRATQMLLQNALEEFGCVLLRLKPFLPLNEYLRAAELIALIAEESAASNPLKPATLHVKPLATTFPQTPVPKETSVEALTLTPRTSSPPKKELLAFAAFDPLTFKETLKAVNSAAENHKQSTFYLCCYVASLPIPLLAIDSWNRVPENEIKEVLEELVKLSALLISDVASLSNHLARNCVLAIGDKLARRLTSTKLTGYALSCALVRNENYIVFLKAAEETRFLQLRNYFCMLSANAKKIFPCKPSIDIDLALQHKQSGQATDLTAHISYLEQFQRGPLTPANCMQLWLGPEPEVISLYKIAILAEGRQLPNPLTVHKDNEGQNYIRLRISQGLRASHLEKYANYGSSFSNDDLVAQVQATNWYAETVDSKTFKQLIEIQRHPLLKIGKTLEWLVHHWTDLSKEEVKDMIRCSLFSPGTLRQRMQTHPETVQDIRTTLEKGLAFCKTNKQHAFIALFLLECGILLESHVAEIEKKPVDEKVLSTYKKELLHLCESHQTGREREVYVKALECTLFLETVANERTEKHFVAIYASLFKIYLYPLGSADTDKIKQWMEIHLQHFHAFLHQTGANKMEALSRLLTEVMKQTAPEWNPQTPPTWRLSTSQTAECDDFVIDLVSGHVRHKRFQAFLCCAHHTNPDERPGGSFWWQFDEHQRSGFKQFDRYLSFNEEELYLVNRDGSNSAVFIKKSPQGTFESTDALVNDAQWNLYFLRYQPLVHRFVSKDVILSTCKKTNRPLFTTDFATNKVIVRKVDSQGKVIPNVVLADLRQLEKNHPLYASTVQFGAPHEILCFVNEKNEIEELEFLNLKITFQRKGSDLESVQFPGYHLAPGRILKELGEHSKALLVLSGPQGKIKVLFPMPQESDGPLGKAERELITRQRPLYKTFDLNHVDEPLSTGDFADKLFWVYFFKLQKDYQRAFLQLQSLSPSLPFNSFAMQTLLDFFYTRDYSPAALAFNMRVVAFAIEHFSLLDTTRNVFLMLAASWHVTYLRVMNADALSPIAKKRRLSEEEEARILATYTLYLKKEHLPKILVDRDALFKSQNRSVTIDFEKPKVTLAPFCYAAIFPPEKIHSQLFDSRWTTPLPSPSPAISALEFPNRFPDHFTQCDFPKLYEEARKAAKANPFESVPFDFKMLALINTMKMDVMGNPLPSLLFYVRYFPTLFPPFTPEAWPTIQEACQKIKLHPHFKEFEKWVLKPEVLFHYSPSTVLSIPPALPAPPLPASKTLPVEKRPFGATCARLFKQKTLPSNGPPSLFDTAAFQKPHEKEVVSKFETAYAQLKTQKKVTYDFDPTSSQAASLELLDKQRTLNNALKASKDKLEGYLNDPYEAFKLKASLEQNVEYRLKLHALQTYLLTPEDVMHKVILPRCGKLLQEERPMLGPTHVQELLLEVQSYYHLLQLEHMTTQALALLKQAPANLLVQEQLLALLNYEFSYDVVAFPEIVYFTVKTGKILRPEQLALHLWISEGLDKGENRAFQVPPGGGKTTIHTPLLILRCKRYHALSAVMATEAMYAVEKENLDATMQTLGETLGTCVIPLESQLSLEEIKMLYFDLKDRIRTGGAIILTAKAFYALRLHYFNATCSHAFPASSLVTNQAPEEALQKKRALGLQLILKLLKQHVILLGDESHQNFDPLTSAIFGVGEYRTLPVRERQLLFELMRHFTTSTKGAQKTLPQVQQSVAESIAKTLLQAAPEQIKTAIVSYWLDPSKPFPALPHEENKPLVYLTQIFIQKLMRALMDMKTEYDHVTAASQGYVETPAHFGTPSHAQFKDPYLACVLTIKGTLERGLNQEQVTQLMKGLIAQDAEELSLATGTLETPTFKLFKTWTALNLREVQPQDARLWPLLRMQTAAIEWYLNQEVMPHIGTSVEQFVSSPAHLMTGFKVSLLFSGTPLPLQAHPTAVQNLKLDEVAEAEIMATALSAPNQKFIFPETPQAFFTHFKAQGAAYKDVRALIDAGGFLCREKNETVADLWLKNSALDGVLYFNSTSEKLHLRLRGRDIPLVRSSPLTEELWQKQNASESRIYLNRKSGKLHLRLKTDLALARGSNHIKEELATLNIDYDNLNVGTFFDAAHAEAANVIQKPGTVAIVFAGESLTLSHAIQAIMRLRGFLNEKMKQTIIWSVAPTLAAKMRLVNDAKAIFAYCLQNEAKARKRGIILAAFQEVAFMMERPVFQEKDTLVAIQKHAAGFKEKTAPRQLWATTSELLDVEAVLWAFAKSCYQKFGFKEDFAKQAQLLEDTGKLIAQVKTKVAKLKMDDDPGRGQKIHQKTVVRAIVKKMIAPVFPQDLVPEKFIPGKTLLTPTYVQTLKPQNQAPFVFKEQHLSNHLYIEDNQLLTAKTKEGVSLRENYLKKIDFLLVTLHKGQFYVEAIANDTLARLMPELLTCPLQSALPHQTFVLRASGALYQLGKGALAPSREIVDKLMHSLEMQDLLADVALINGHIPTTDGLQKRLKAWPTFHEFIQRVLKAHPHKTYTIETLAAYQPAESLSLAF